VTDEWRDLGDAECHLITCTDDAAEMLRWLSTKTEIGYDTETTGLDKDNDRVRLVQVSDANTAWVIPFERWAGVVDDLVARYEGIYDMHNAPYDVALSRNGGIIIPTHKVKDTRLMAHVLSSTQPLALKKLAQRHVDVRAGAAQEALNAAIGGTGGWTWANVPVTFQPYWMYAGLDPILTYRLREKLEPLVLVDAPRSYELEMAVSWVCERMERNGAHIDLQHTQKFSDELLDYIDQVEKWCLSVYGVKPGTTQDVVRVLEAAGVQLFKHTAKGAISLDADVLSNVNHPIAGAVLGRRQAQKINSTYLRHYLEDVGSDGRVHPSINTVGGTSKNPFESGGGGRGVRTGRMSMDHPNLQNVPVRTKEGKKIRNCFDVEPDHTWIKADAEQIEMRLFAHVAHDQNMINAFKNEGDFFLSMTHAIFNDNTIKKDDVRRQHVKNSGYAIIYGAGIEQFAKTANIRDQYGQIDLVAASAFIQRFKEVNPGVPRYQAEVERIAAQRFRDEGESYARSPLTNRKHVADQGREYALVNYIIQGTAGELLKMKMLECDAAGLGEFMTIPVHDEIDFDVPNDRLEDVTATLRDVLNDDKLLDVPFTWSIETGPRWGECK
jgi:DNA polymerase-1